MKKNSKIIFGLMAISVLALAGCGNKSAQNPSANNQQAPAADSGQSVADTVKKSLFDFMTTGAGVKCTVDDPTNGQMTMLAKGDKVKVDGFSYAGLNTAATKNPDAQAKGTMVNDGTWVYMWSAQQGIKFNIKNMEALSQQDKNQPADASQKNSSDWKDWIKEMDAKGTKYDCSPTVVNDSDFAAPADVKFQDLGEMMKGFLQMGNQLQKNMPNVPGAQNIPNVQN